MDETLFFLICLILSLLGQGFFAMSEMAFVSFNRVRLAYYVEKQKKGAIFLSKLLNKPTALFGTTLIGVNFFLQLGSECGRRVFYTIGIDPDFAYIPQVFIVLIFAELLPLFAARAHSEHLAMFVVKPIYVFSKLFTPLIFLIDCLSKVVTYFLKAPLTVNSSLSRDELKNLLTDSEGVDKDREREDLEPLIQNIFSIKTKSPRDLMVPIDKMPCVSYDGVVGDVRNHLYDAHAKYVPLYHEKIDNIFGIAYSQDLLNLSDSSLVKDIARSPWFIIETNTIFQVINQFRKNNQKIAIVLDKEGSVVGVLSLSKIIDEIFSGILLNQEALDEHARIYLDKSFSLDTKVSDLKTLFKIAISEQGDATLENLMAKKLGYSPKDKDSTLIGEYELIFESATFPQDRRIRVKTRM